MTDAPFLPPAPTERTTLAKLLLLTGSVFLGMTLGGVTALLILLPTGQNAIDLLQNPTSYANGWYWIMAVQAASHVCSFLLPALAYWYFFEKRQWADFQVKPLTEVAALSAVALIVIAFMPFDGLIIEWNQHLNLPDALEPVERWMRDKEDELAGLTKSLTTFQGPGQLAVAVLVIAVIPAIGEEVLFRGVLQRILVRGTGNVHAGIWLAAIIFSAIHVQFYGFVPRVLLGAMFGYLYVWSGNLWVAILAHFVNNGFTVLMVYLYQKKLTGVDIEATDSVPIPIALASFALWLGLMYYFRQRNRKLSYD
jgi:uncharacterized protein